MEKTRAILLRRSRFSDSSLVCVWMSVDFGKIRTSARGALRPTSPFAGSLDLFHEADIGFARSRSGDIHHLREIVLRQSFDGFATKYANLAAASYFAELVDHVTEPQGHAAEMFDLLHRAIGYLRLRPVEPRAISHFEVELCRALGILGKHAAPVKLLDAHCSRFPLRARERALKATLAPPGTADKME